MIDVERACSYFIGREKRSVRPKKIVRGEKERKTC
jgi:hypothetical protein